MLPERRVAFGLGRRCAGEVAVGASSRKAECNWALRCRAQWWQCTEVPQAKPAAHTGGVVMVENLCSAPDLHSSRRLGMFWKDRLNIVKPLATTAWHWPHSRRNLSCARRGGRELILLDRSQYFCPTAARAEGSVCVSCLGFSEGERTQSNTEYL
jgi:hypothetical protein